MTKTITHEFTQALVLDKYLTVVGMIGFERGVFLKRHVALVLVI